MERERGITVIAQTASMLYRHQVHKAEELISEEDYILNLIDTPGHVDFSYQVSRSIRACEGALLIVDATKGIQAQTISNFYKAFDAGLQIIPIVNKVELQAADVAGTVQQLKEQFDFEEEEMLFISAKTGHNVDQVFDAIIDRVPPPLNLEMQHTQVHTSEADKLSKSAEKLENKQVHDVIDAKESSESENHLKAFLFDARYVPNRGVACLIKIMAGGQLDWAKLKFLTSYHTGIKYDLYDVGIVQPQMKKTGYLPQGQVGYFLSNMKSVSEAHIGDTFFDDKVSKEQIRPFPGYETPQSMVYSGIYPEDPDDYEELEKSLKKLCLTDGSISISYESSAALGSGFRCGFLGMLHLDVFRQRLVDEYDMSAIIT